MKSKPKPGADEDEPTPPEASAPVSVPVSVDAFQAFFETLESPAALCDAQLRLLATSPAFELLCGVRGASGLKLSQLLAGISSAVPADGHSSEIDVPVSTGQLVTLTLSRRGET